MLKKFVFTRPMHTLVDGASANNSTFFSSVSKKWKHKFINPIQVDYTDVTTGDDAAVNNVGIRMMAFASNYNDVTPDIDEKCTFQWNARIGFYDHKS